MKQKSISTGKKIGGERVNKFFRKKNQQHTDNYKTMIQKENDKNKQNKKAISSMSKTIQGYEDEVYHKQRKLKKLMDEISFYSVEGQYERKGNFLANSEFMSKASSQKSERAQVRFMKKNNKKMDSL